MSWHTPFRNFFVCYSLCLTTSASIEYRSPLLSFTEGPPKLSLIFAS